MVLRCACVLSEDETTLTLLPVTYKGKITLERTLSITLLCPEARLRLVSV